MPESTAGTAGSRAVRPRPGGSGTCNRLNQAATSAVVMKNQSVGRSWEVAASLEKRFDNGFYAKVAYDYGQAKNTVDPGSIALGTWQGVAIVDDPNNPGLHWSTNSPGHRFFAADGLRAGLVQVRPDHPVGVL